MVEHPAMRLIDEVGQRRGRTPALTSTPRFYTSLAYQRTSSGDPSMRGSGLGGILGDHGLAPPRPTYHNTGLENSAPVRSAASGTMQ